MLRCLLATALLMLVIAGLPGPTEAAPAVCNIRTSPGAMSFTIDPSLPGPITAMVTIQPVIRCSPGIPFTVRSRSANFGGAFGGPPTTGRLSDGVGHQFNYTIGHLANGVGLGMGGAGNISLNLSGTVNRVDYENAYLCVAPCAYTDTVTLQVTY